LDGRAELDGDRPPDGNDRALDATECSVLLRECDLLGCEVFEDVETRAELGELAVDRFAAPLLKAAVAKALAVAVLTPDELTLLVGVEVDVGVRVPARRVVVCGRYFGRIKFSEPLAGVAFARRNNEPGFTVKLNTLPISGWNGAMVLVPPFVQEDEPIDE
jgi:hypothetical protein